MKVNTNIPVHDLNEKKVFIKWREIHVVPGIIEQAHRHNYLQILFLENVKGSHDIDFKTYKAENKSLHFIGKGRVHRVDFEPNTTGDVITFPEELFGNAESELKLLFSFTFFKNGARPFLNLKSDDFNTVKDFIEKIKKAVGHNAMDTAKYLLFALLTFIRDIYDGTEGPVASSKPPAELILFNKLLKERINEFNSVEKFTNEIGITSTRLNQLCKTQYGLTALQMLHNSKLLEAKRMLVYTNKQVKEIAYNCGFEDVAYFNRFFKKKIDCTPLTFRRSH